MVLCHVNSYQIPCRLCVTFGLKRLGLQRHVGLVPYLHHSVPKGG